MRWGDPSGVTQTVCLLPRHCACGDEANEFHRKRWLRIPISLQDNSVVGTRLLVCCFSIWCLGVNTAIIVKLGTEVSFLSGRSFPMIGVTDPSGMSSECGGGKVLFLP